MAEIMGLSRVLHWVNVNLKFILINTFEILFKNTYFKNTFYKYFKKCFLKKYLSLIIFPVPFKWFQPLGEISPRFSQNENFAEELLIAQF